MTLVKQNTQIESLVPAVINDDQRLKSALDAKMERKRKEALIDAETLSQRDKALHPKELDLKVEEIRQDYRTHLADVGIALNPNSQGLLGNHENKEYAQELNEKALEQGEVRKKKESHPTVGHLPPTPLSGFEHFLLAAPFIILALDAIFEAPALRMLGGSGLLAYGSAILLNGFKYFFAKFLNGRIRTAVTKQSLYFWVGLGLTAFAVVAVLLGMARHAYLQMQDGTSIYGPFVLAVLSFIFSVGAWIAEYLSEPVRDKKAQIKEENKSFEEFYELVAEEKALEEEIKSLKKERSGRLGSRLISMDNARSLEQAIEDHYKGTVNRYQTTYHARRVHRDGEKEVYLTQIPPLKDAQSDYEHIQNQKS